MVLVGSTRYITALLVLRTSGINSWLSNQRLDLDVLSSNHELSSNTLIKATEHAAYQSVARSSVVDKVNESTN